MAGIPLEHLPEAVGAIRHLKVNQKMPNWLDKAGRLAPRSCAEYDAVDEESRRVFCHKHARYLLVTTELVEWLKGFIRGRSAIEIGAGAGDLGRALGIKMVDNYQQQWDDVRTYYKQNQQPTIQYGTDVTERDANSAIRKWQPDVVIGSWITEYISPNEMAGPGGGNIYGIKEDELLPYCEQYVLIGSEKVHCHKKLMKLPHEVFDAPFVRSRSNRNDDKIWVWQGSK